MLLCLTVLGALSQNRSQETVNALNDQRINQLEIDTRAHGSEIAVLAREISALKSSIDRFTGLGIGIGVTLTTIQALQLIMAFRKGK